MCLNYYCVERSSLAFVLLTTSRMHPLYLQPVNVEAPPPVYQPTPAQRIDTEDLRRRQEELDRKAAELQVVFASRLGTVMIVLFV